MWRPVNAVGHHDDDAASMLGAQMIGGHLRDGRRMLLPSGTNGALIDPSDGLEKRSHMFDRFRTRAFHPLVEVHFSRF